MFSLPINLQTLLLWSKTGNMLCQGIMRAGSFLSDCYQFLLTILFFLTVVTDMKLHNKEAVKCYLWKHIQSMRVLKTFVLLDIALFTGVTSFKCISVQLLTLSAVQTPPPEDGPTVCNKSMSLTAGVTFTAVGRLFSVVCQSVFPSFLRKKNGEKSSEGHKRMQSAVRLGGPGHALGFSRGLGEAASFLPFSGLFRRC